MSETDKPEGPAAAAATQGAPSPPEAQALSPKEAAAALWEMGIGTAPGATLEATAFDAPQLIGRTLGHYRIQQKIGQGGMGTVFKAFDAALERTVALKVLHCGPLDDPKTAERFKREALGLARLSHPNLLHVFDVGADEHLHYFAMELLEGLSLSDLLKRRKRLSADAWLPYAGQILSALHYVHRQGITHRDIKSGNIMLCESRAVLMDFGLAKNEQFTGLTSFGAILGTPEYMAPEQAEGRSLGPPTDLYSFGVVLYEALSGELPFAGRSAFSIIQQHMSSPPPELAAKVPALDPRLAAVVARCLSKKGADRYPSCMELAAGLAAVCPTPELLQLAGLPGLRTSVSSQPPKLAISDETERVAADTALEETRPMLPRPAPAGVTVRLDEALDQERSPAWIWVLVGFAGMLALGLLGIWGFRRPSGMHPDEQPVRLESVLFDAGRDLRIAGFERPGGTLDQAQWTWVIEWSVPDGQRKRETITGYQEFLKRFPPKENFAP